MIMKKIKNITTYPKILQFNQLRNGDLFIFIDGKDGEGSQDILIRQSNKIAVHLTMGDNITFPNDRKVRLVSHFEFFHHF